MVPTALRGRPFTIEEAARVGITWDQLQSRAYRRLPCGIYVTSAVNDTPLLHLRAAHLRLPATAAFSGLTAAWLHGVAAPPATIEATVPRETGMSSLVGVTIRRTRFAEHEVVRRHGLPVTSLLRTLIDVSRTRPLLESVVIVDAALHRGFIDLDNLVAAAPRRGLGRWRRVVEQAEPRSESPMESLLRMLLIQAGLPRPEAQVELWDGRGVLLGRVDLYYPSHRLVIEYDGGTHRDSLVADNRRQNRILAAGYTIRRFTAADVRDAPGTAAAIIRADLARPSLAA